MTWVIKLSVGEYKGRYVPQGKYGELPAIMNWPVTRKIARDFGNLSEAYECLAEWNEGALRKWKPRIVRLRPKAPVRDEAAIRKAERERIAGLIAAVPAEYFVKLGKSVVAAHVFDAVSWATQLSDAIRALDWPVPK